MKKTIIFAIILAVIIVVSASILSINPIFLNDGLEPAPNNTEKVGQSIPVGRNLSVELQEEMGFGNP